MNTAGPSATTARGGPRGRIDKRRAILDAAFTVFAREGYSHASVDAIATEAGVAKPTIYNHFDDKEHLFRECIVVDADRVIAKNLAAVERLHDVDGDLRPVLESVGAKLLSCSCDPRAWALRRLLYAEIVRFPDLQALVQGSATNRVEEALADRFARLALAGRLRARDPVQAAEQFLALLTGPIEARSALGTRMVTEAEIREVAVAAVDTFLQAFTDEPARP